MNSSIFSAIGLGNFDPAILSHLTVDFILKGAILVSQGNDNPE